MLILSVVLAAAFLAVAGSRPAAHPVRIALLSDPHVTRSMADDKPLYRPHFEEAIRAVNAADVDVVLIAGDLTDGGLAEQFRDFKALIRAFKAPVLYVPGNHDVGDKRIAGKSGAIQERRVSAYEKMLGPSFYVKTVAGLRVIGIDSSLLGSGLTQEQAQWELLDRELSLSSAAPTVLLMHYPLFIDSAEEPGGGYWNIEAGPRDRLMALLRKGNVDAVLTGHLHRPLINHLGDVLLYTTPPVSFGLPPGKQPEGWTLVSIRGPKDIVTEFHAVPHRAPDADR